MFEPWSVVATSGVSNDESELRQIYGEEAVISRLGDYNLIHLDMPEAGEIERRVAAFDPEDLFDDDCPLCRSMRKQKLDVVFLGKNGDEDDADA